MTTEARRLIKANGGEDSEAAKQAVIDYLFGEAQIAHLYRALPDGYCLSKYDHTPEDQGKFYKDTVSRLSKLKFMCGFYMYMYSDSLECYQCGQEGCPVETGWGLVSFKKLADGESYSEETVIKKPSFYAIQEVYGAIKAKEAGKY